MGLRKVHARCGLPFAALVLGSLLGCGGGGGSGGGGSGDPAAPPAPAQLAGRWKGTWIGAGGTVGGGVEGDLAQVGSDLTGTLTLSFDPGCSAFHDDPGEDVGTLVGQVSGNAASGQIGFVDVNGLTGAVTPYSLAFQGVAGAESLSITYPGVCPSEPITMSLVRWCAGSGPRGDGTFRWGPQVATLPFGIRVERIVVADLDGDGDQDLAVAVSNAPGSGAVVALRNNGDETLTALAPSAVGADPVDLVVADFDEDGRLDLATANAGASATEGVSLLRGVGDGTFTLAASPAASALFAVGIATGDFNGDGHADLASLHQAPTPGRIVVRLGRGDGTFVAAADVVGAGQGSPARSLSRADLDGDGGHDLVALVATGAVPFRSVGDGTFGIQPPLSAASSQDGLLTDHPTSMLCLDLNRDGASDVLWASTSAPWRFLHAALSSGGGAFSATAAVGGRVFASVASMASGDLDGDGIADVLLSEPSPNAICAMRGLQSGRLGPSQVVAGASASPSVLVAADLNGDGVLDLAVGDNTGFAVQVFYGVGCP